MRFKNYFKFLVSFVFMLGISLTVSAQKHNHTEQCGTEMSAEEYNRIKSMLPQLKKYEQEYLQARKSNNTPILNSVPIKAHIVRNFVGGTNTPFTETDLNDAITLMNSYFQNSGLEFFLCDGINYIDSNTFFNFDSSQESQLTSANQVSGLVNIYFVNSITTSGGGSAAGYAYLPGGPATILMTHSATKNGSTLTHEMGHFFGLAHTHGPVNGTLTTELVNGSNCDTDGDLVCDTPADPQLGGNNVDSNCNYTGNAVDANFDPFDPDETNIMSYSIRACRTNITTQQFARMYAFSRVDASRNNFSCPTLNVALSSDVNSTCNSTLSVNFTDNSTGATSWQWDVDGDNVIDYTTQNISHTYNTAGSYDVSLIISDGTTTISKKFDNFISVGTQNNLPVSEDLNNISSITELKWTSIDGGGNGFEWLINSGGTPSPSTGPLNGSGGTGNYFFTEGSGTFVGGSGTGQPGDVAELISYCVELNANDAELTFDYHMWSADIGMGELHVDIDDGSGWTNDIMTPLVGSQQTNQADDFMTATVDLAAYANKNVKIRFRGIRGNNFTSDIAIDNVQINSKSGTLSTNTEAIQNLAIYPNPVNGSFLNVVNNSYTNGERLNYEVRNVLGQSLSRGRVENNKVDIASLAPGTYILVLKVDNAQIAKKFIKQ
ncbi:MAG: hypothetical protein CMB99_08625 [Flavobacteriaceae bacterium]|nr:hypothetical protein [Flavobacteriaceae bacterium]